MTMKQAGAMVALGLVFMACGDGPEQRSSTPMGPAQGDVAGGETSEFSGGDIPACPCGTLKNPLRATVTALGDETVRVRVDELLGGTSTVEVGSEIEGGLWYGGLPCYVGHADIAVADEVLAFYWPSTTPTSAARISLTRWSQKLLLADATRDLTISIDDLPLLDAPDAECRAGLGNIADYIGPNDELLP